MSSEHAISYVRDLENASIKNNNEPFLASQAEVIRQGVKRKELADLMQNLLSFNPFFRLTALECVLECPFFDEVRDAAKEKVLQKMKTFKKPLLELEIDSIEAFDYEDATKAKYSVDELLQKLYKEIREIQANYVNNLKS